MLTEALAQADLRTSHARAAAEAVLSLAGTVDRSLDRHAGEFGISDAKLEVLELLSCCAGRRACLHTLGDRLSVTRPNITKLIDGLERAGLVRRLPHPEDRRRVQAELTPDGATLAARALPGRVARLEGLWEQVDDAELAELAAVLTRVATAASARWRPAEDDAPS